MRAEQPENLSSQQPDFLSYRRNLQPLCGLNKLYNVVTTDLSRLGFQTTRNIGPGSHGMVFGGGHFLWKALVPNYGWQ